MKNLTREQKQDVQAVVRKYVPEDRTSLYTGILAGSGLASVVDMIATGGMATMAGLISGMLTGAGVGAGIATMADNSMKTRSSLYTNRAGQNFRAPYDVAAALWTMEDRLSAAFKKAAKDPGTRQAFLDQCREAEADLKKLTPAFEIERRSDRLPAESFEFVLERETQINTVIKTLSDVQSGRDLPAPETSPSIRAMLKLASSDKKPGC